MREIDKLAKETVAVAEEVGRKTMLTIDGQSTWRSKGLFDIQIKADLEAEGEIVPRLRKLLPEAEVASEEMLTPVDWSKSAVWIVDPLDGTNNFHASIPYLAISIGLRQSRRLVLAVIRDPVLEHTYIACPGSGAKKDGEYLHPVPGKALDKSTVSLITNYSIDGRKAGERLYLRLNSLARRVTTLWAPAADLVRASTGHIDAVVCVNALYGDVCCGLLIVAEAGGSIFGPDGNDVDVPSLDPAEPVSFVASLSRKLARELFDSVDFGRYVQA
jgi:myo-inositol-1(or 4)-monophosphatase